MGRVLTDWDSGEGDGLILLPILVVTITGISVDYYR